MDYPHLHPSVLPYLSLSDPERVQKINSARWIGYTQAGKILKRMRSLFDQPRIDRMSGMLIVGGTNQGKTTLLKKFYNEHLPVDKSNAQHTEVPVALVLSPPGPDEKRFYGAVLRALGFPCHPTADAEARLFQIEKIVPQVGCRMLLLDELHNVLAGNGQKRAIFLNALRNLSTSLKISIVGAGIVDALEAVALEPQLRSRLLPMFLPEWKDDAEFTRLLIAFGKLLPLKNPSMLTSKPIADEILELSEGVLGEASALLTQAASEAVGKGEEITLKLIRSLDFVRPSRRNKVRESDYGDGGVLDFPDNAPRKKEPPQDLAA